MFDAAVFKDRLARQLTDFGLVCNSAWELAPNVFTAQLKEPDDEKWTFIFYCDLTEAKPRDPRLIHRTLGLLMMGGVTYGTLSEDKDDPVLVTHFFGNVLADDFLRNPGDALNVATQLFVGKDGTELAWFDYPQQIDIPQFAAVTGS